MANQSDLSTAEVPTTWILIIKCGSAVFCRQLSSSCVSILRRDRVSDSDSDSGLDSPVIRSVEYKSFDGGFFAPLKRVLAPSSLGRFS